MKRSRSSVDPVKPLSFMLQGPGNKVNQTLQSMHTHGLVFGEFQEQGDLEIPVETTERNWVCYSLLQIIGPVFCVLQIRF